MRFAAYLPDHEARYARGTASAGERRYYGLLRSHDLASPAHERT